MPTVKLSKNAEDTFRPTAGRFYLSDCGLVYLAVADCDKKLAFVFFGESYPCMSVADLRGKLVREVHPSELTWTGY
jgi:hypothetical protein